jgi:hypothetical protein
MPFLRFMRSVRRLVVFALLAWLPLQSVAQPALMLACGIDGGASSGIAASGDANEHEHPCHGGGDEGSSGGAQLLLHGCCHNVAFVSPAIAAMPAEAPRAPREAAPPPYAYRFFPDQPKRPPLAAL